MHVINVFKAVFSYVMHTATKDIYLQVDMILLWLACLDSGNACIVVVLILHPCMQSYGQEESSQCTCRSELN